MTDLASYLEVSRKDHGRGTTSHVPPNITATSQAAISVASVQLKLVSFARTAVHGPSNPTLAPPPIMGYYETLYEVEFSAWQIATLKRAFYGASAPIGPARGAAPEHAAAPSASDRQTKKTGVAGCTAARRLVPRARPDCRKSMLQISDTGSGRGTFWKNVNEFGRNCAKLKDK